MRPLIPILFILSIIIGSCSHKDYDYIIHNINVIDVLNDSLLENQSIFITGKVIDHIQPSKSTHKKQAVNAIDGHNQYAIPGMIESHFHLHPYYDTAMHIFDRAMNLFLANGITGIREAAGQQYPEELIKIRDSINQGLKFGPQLSVSGITTAQNRQKLGAKDNIELVYKYNGLGIDAIKLKYNNLHESQEIIKLAAQINKPVYGHTANLWVNQTSNILGDFTLDLVEIGINGIVHVSGFPQIGKNDLPEAPGEWPLIEMPDNWEDWWLYSDKLWLYVDPQAENLLIRKMVENNVWFEPTLFIEDFMYFYYRYKEKPESKYFLLGHHEELGFGFPEIDEEEVAVFEKVFEAKQNFVKKFHEAGGIILAGTDGMLCGFDLHTEMELLVDAGISELEVIKTATLINSQVIGFDNKGHISAGMDADIVLLKSNPLKDISNIRKIEGVFQSGKYLDTVWINHSKAEILQFIQEKTQDSFQP